MSRIKSIMLCLSAAFVLSAIAAPIALASEEGPEWWVGHNLLKGSEAIAEETKVTTPFKIEAHGEKVGTFTIECTQLGVVGGSIESPNIRREEGIVLSECKVVGKPECIVTTIKTKPLKATLEGTPGDIKLKFAPQSGSEIAQFEISGAGCAQDGGYEADGTMICNYKGVESESKEHPLEFTGTSGSEIKLNGEAVTFSGTDKVHLESNKLWSARF